MRQTLSRVLIYCMSTAMIILLMYSCRKSDHHTTSQADEITKRTTQQSRTEHPRNRKVPVGLLKNGVIHPLPAGGSQTQSGRGGCDEYIYTTQLTYLGYSDYAAVCDEDRDFQVAWYLDLPEEITPLPSDPTTYATWGMAGNWYYPTISITYHSSFNHPTEGNPMYRWLVSFTFTLTNSQWCNNEYFQHWFNIATDCNQLITPNEIVYITEYFDEQDVYQTYIYGANNATTSNPTVHRFQAFPFLLVCEPCHGPELGPSPEHQFRYGLQGTPVNTWTTVTRTNLLSFYVVVGSAGTYEYQSRGKIDASGNFTVWSSVSTVVVL